MVAYASVEDFLYILIGIAWVVFSFYKAQKKKKAPGKKQPQPQKTEETKETPSFLDSLLDELGVEMEPEQKKEDDEPYIPYNYDEDLIEKTYVTDVHKENIRKEQSEVFSYDDIYEESNYTEVTDVNDKKKSAFETNTTSVFEDKKPSLKKQKKVDLRKAIIYSEILKRQYF